MINIIEKRWWVFALRGLIAVALGIIALVNPGIALLTLIIIFGIYSFVDGLFDVIISISNRKDNEKWWALLIAGIASVVIGVISLSNPSITGIALVYLIAVKALINGVLEIAAAIELRHFIEGEWMMVISGILSILFGIVLFASPNQGALAMLWVIGIFAIVIGVWLIIFAFHLRSKIKKIKQHLEEYNQDFLPL